MGFLVFKYPSRDRVKERKKDKGLKIYRCKSDIAASLEITMPVPLKGNDRWLQNKQLKISDVQEKNCLCLLPNKRIFID